MAQDTIIVSDAKVIDKIYGKDSEAYWQKASPLSSSLLEQSSNAVRIAE